ncbi:Orotidine 5'-phosphate decarboxylase [Mollisia scopiformis]|uniref:Orotidine 5'-phosphate decarboxylase n=1 Tax=Mollisia scopiformis TaxID=149040 RepID=A0A194XNV6_MOLSC|nr:Orotidine 5'-phosphate decarboxylase [Mollisia scopiformis]KUJ21858.1 Orotidine 5'-phosphate decarboxylase [Mollisia scopiformis]
MSPNNEHPTSSNTHHVTARQSYALRAEKATHPLTSYLLRLMTLKSSNLCLSADVSTANQLLSLANSLGPAIVVLKTHYDLISNWDYNPSTGTAARLARIARRHGFLIFEDRKFGDIGNTVQLQYTEGTARIVEWANITNVNMVPGKAAVDALAEAGRKWRERKRYELNVGLSADRQRERDGRKASIVSITTVSQHFEPANSPRSGGEDFGEEVLRGIEEAPLERGLLILAQMSSKGNFMNKEYTDACVESARENSDFVMGFIAQESLNRQEDDQFLCMTPGCQLPPAEDEDAEVKGDGKGQQYNTPQKLIGQMGADIIIVGRGIIKAADPIIEAERYRQKGWEAYEERIA